MSTLPTDEIDEQAMNDKTMILNTSDEAAKLTTVTGWVSRTGIFFGTDERIARYAGCTHILCACGQATKKSHTACESCRTKKRAERYAALPTAKWDGLSMLCVFDGDQYFSTIEEAEEYAECNDTTLEALQLVICKPKKYRTIDPNEYYCDDLPEDGEVDSDIQAAFDALNDAIQAHESPISWWPGKVALAL